MRRLCQRLRNWRRPDPWRLACEQMAQLAAVKDDFDGYGAEAPNDVAMRRMRDVLYWLEQADFPPDRVAPSTDAGVCFSWARGCFSWRRGGRYADIECFNTGEALAVVCEHHLVPDVWRVRDGELADAVARIKDFIEER